MMNTTKKLLTLLLALLLPVTALALPPYDGYDVYDFEVGGIYYVIAGDVVGVSCKRHDYGNYLSDYSGDVIIPSCVTYQGKTYPVTFIDDFAFNYCEGLTSVTIPESITTIKAAFNGCTGLTRVIIKDLAAWCNIKLVSGLSPLVYAHHLYLNDEEVTKLIIPDGITAIKDYVFQGCTELTSVTIPSSVTTIGQQAFEGCTALTEIICLPTTPPNASLTGSFDSDCYKRATLFVTASAIGEYRYSYPWRNFNSIQSIESGGGAVYDFEVGGIYYKVVDDEASVTCKSHTYSAHTDIYESDYTDDVIIPATVTYQGRTYSVTSIYDHAFDYCTGLTSITLPNTILTISHDAFRGCTGLTSIEIPCSVTAIGYSAFDGCTGLTGVKISDIAAWCNISFNEHNANPLNLAHHLYLNDVEVTDLTIPESVTSIGHYAFIGCKGLTSIKVPNTVTTIGTYSFFSCTGLEKVSLGNAVTRIDESAFMYCTALKDIEIPNSVTSIGIYAFYECTALTSVTIPDSVTTIGASAFNGCSKLTRLGIGNSVTDIGADAFNNCSSLSSVMIGNSVRNIGKNAFQHAPAIESITCLAMYPPWWSDMSMFTADVYHHAQLHVPTGCEGAYKADHYWSQFQTIIGDAGVNKPGDVNGDGSINISDANSVIEIIVSGSNGHDRVDGDGHVIGDMNGDRSVNISDLNIIIDAILKNK